MTIKPRPKQPSWAKWGSIALVVLVMAGGLGLGAYLYTTQQFQTELRETLVDNCNTIGNPGREAELEDIEEGVEDLEEELTDPKDPRITKLFPNVSEQYAEELITEQNQTIREKIRHKQAREAKLGPVNCEEQYPH